MFRLFKKSPQKIADQLLPVIIEVGRNIVGNNPLALSTGTPEYGRFSIGAYLFAELLCEDELCGREGTGGTMALTISKILTEQYIGAVARTQAALCRVSEIVVWNDETQSIRQNPINPKLAGAGFSTVQLPLGDIVRELHVVRLARMTTDMLKGAAAIVHQGRQPLALLMPVSSTLILQTTADHDWASDENTVTKVAASLMPQWMYLKASVEKASA